MSEIPEWRANIEKNIRELNERVTQLEKKQELDKIWQMSISNPCPSESVIESGINKDEDGCIKKWVHLLKASWASRIQFLLLLACFVSFIYCGVVQFKRAKQNEEAEYKPEKKQYTKNYGDGIATNNYELPYFFFHVYINLGNTRTEDTDIDELIHQMLESQHQFTNSSVIVYVAATGSDETYELLEPDEVVNGRYPIGENENGFWAWFRVKHKKPDPLMGRFYLMIRIELGSLLKSQNMTLDYCSMSLTRELEFFKPFKGVWLDEAADGVNIYMVSYWESTINRLDSNKINNLEITRHGSGKMTVEQVDMDLNISTATGDAVAIIMPDLLVEHWEEYVEYGYWEWFTSMGGLFSIISSTFFLMAYYIGANLSANVSKVGILGEMSVLYSNLEKIICIKKYLKDEIDARSKTQLIATGETQILCD